MSFVRYLKREQYVIPPLLFGPYFTAQPIGIKPGPAKYVKGKDKYETRERKRDLEYDREDETVLPVGLTVESLFSRGGRSAS